MCDRAIGKMEHRVERLKTKQGFVAVGNNRTGESATVRNRQI